MQKGKGLDFSFFREEVFGPHVKLARSTLEVLLQCLESVDCRKSEKCLRFSPTIEVFGSRVVFLNQAAAKHKVQSTSELAGELEKLNLDFKDVVLNERIIHLKFQTTSRSENILLTREIVVYDKKIFKFLKIHTIPLYETFLILLYSLS